MAHFHKLTGHPGVTQMQASLQQTYYRWQMAADVTSAVRDFVHFAKIGLSCASELVL